MGRLKGLFTRSSKQRNADDRDSARKMERQRRQREDLHEQQRAYTDPTSLQYQANPGNPLSRLNPNGPNSVVKPMKPIHGHKH